MTRAEFPKLSPDPFYTEERYRHGPFGRGRKHSHSAGTSPAKLPTPEQTNLENHKERVATQISALFDEVDAGVGRLIGHTGNIREELKGRIISKGSSSQRSINTDGLDPSIARYLQHDIFFFRLDNERGGPAAMYKVDCQVGRFMPSIEVETNNGFVEASLFTGPNRDESHHAQIRRVFNDERVRRVTTFTPNYMNPYDPPHPLVIEQGVLPMPSSHMIYDTIDAGGNVSLLNEQSVSDPSGRFRGRYSSVDNTISPLLPNDPPFPYRATENELILGNAGLQVEFPIQTNIYAELAAIAANIRAIVSD